MTEIKKKALALVNEVAKHYRANIGEADFDEVERAFYRAIEQHEAFKRGVSDAIERAFPHGDWAPHGSLAPFILAKPDPLVEAMSEAMCGVPGEDYTQPAKDLRAALAARGLEVRKIGEGE